LFKGWTTVENADAYASYLRNELFPRLERELTGYRGYHVLRLSRADQVEFVTLVWFESLAAVQSFAGETYEVPVISDAAKRLLSRYQDRCDHYELSSFRIR
jgi:heme-degrading monooxygenase HmoA